MEWEYVMAAFKDEVDRLRRTAAWTTAAGQAAPLWSFDNDTIHQNPQSHSTLKINKNNRVPLPPNSPDMHRVVERSIGRLKKAFQSWLFEHPSARSMQQYRTALKKMFHKNETADVVSAEVASLPDVYREIVSRRVNGGWPAKEFL